MPSKLQLSHTDLDAIEQTAIQNTELGNCIIDPEFSLIKVNSTLEQTLTRSSAELFGETFFSLFARAQHDEIRAALNLLATRANGTYCHSLRLKTSPGISIPVYAIHKRVEHESTYFICSRFLHLPRELQFGDNFSDTDTFQQLIVDSDVDIVYVKNKDFNVVFSNNYYKSLFPEDNAETFSKQNPESNSHDLLAFKQGQLETRETLVISESESIIVQARRTRITKSNGESFVVCIAKDITEHEVLVNQLRRSNEDLGQFAYVASHDLRSPLNAIEKLVTWIEDDGVNELPESSKEYFTLIKQRVGRLMNLLDDLLSFAKIGKSEYELAWINLESLAANIKSLMDPADRFSIEAPDIDLFVPQVPFEMTIRNLISNAIKHHDKPKGNIRIEYEEQYPDHVIKVIDDGPGIAPDMHDKAMEIFQTLKPRDEVEGSGMGLALIKRIMDLYGGSVTIDSDGANGTAITIKWNIADH